MDFKKPIDIKYHTIIKSIYDVIDDTNLSIVDSTAKTLLAIAFFYTGMKTDINECTKKISSQVAFALESYSQIVSFDTFENVLELYNNERTYQIFVEACINFIKDVNGEM